MLLTWRAAAALGALLAAGAVRADMALNPDVYPATIAETICTSGYTKEIRPSTTYTNGVKFKLMREAGIPRSESETYALDHIVPLVLGGSPRSIDNLRLLTAAENSRKSRIEVKLRCMVCSGHIPLEEAQQAIYTDWKAAYHHYAPTKCYRPRT
jgi:cytochrome c-type biogenesis protein CcmH/NrfF